MDLVRPAAFDDVDGMERELEQPDVHDDHPHSISWTDDAAWQVTHHRCPGWDPVRNRLQLFLLNKTCVPYFVEWCNTPMPSDRGRWILSFLNRCHTGPPSVCVYLKDSPPRTPPSPSSQLDLGK
eukprot:5619265-Amphidinium_carterae.1